MTSVSQLWAGSTEHAHICLCVSIASDRMHSWILAYANTGLYVQIAACSPEISSDFGGPFQPPPAAPTPFTRWAHAEYSPGCNNSITKGHHRLHSIFQHPQQPHCLPSRCHVATWAPATLCLQSGMHEKSRESKGNYLLSLVEWSRSGSSPASAFHAWLAWVPLLSPWLTAMCRVAGTCPCWETWRPWPALMVSSFLTSCLLEFTSGSPPSGCQGARLMPTASPWIKQGAFPSCTWAPLKHSAVLSSLEQMGPIKVLVSSTTSAKYPSTGIKSGGKNKSQQGSLFSALKMQFETCWEACLAPCSQLGVAMGLRSLPCILHTRTSSCTHNSESYGLHFGSFSLRSLFQLFRVSSFTPAAAPCKYRSKPFTSGSAGKQDKEFHCTGDEMETSQKGFYLQKV